MSTLAEAWDEFVRLATQEQGRNMTSPGMYPHFTEKGRWRRLGIDATSGWVDENFYDHGNWTAGFAAGQAWLAHLGDSDVSRVARTQARTLDDVARRASDKTTHDLGFLFHPSFVMGEHLGFLTVGDLGPALEAARALAERFNPDGGYLQAFGPIGDPRSRATSTIDTMMNLPLLLWAARFTGEDQFRRRAMTHAETTAANFFRPDGSTYHLIRYDPSTGAAVAKGTFQGASDESCWSRGQAWAIAGFAWCYAETRSEQFRRAAERAWDYFAPRIPSDCVVPYDFGDSEDTTEDASASAVAALGALILAGSAEDVDGGRALRSTALSILKGLHENAVRHDEHEEGILLRSCYSKPHGQGLSGALPYGDYYYGLAVALATGKVSLPQLLERDRAEQGGSRDQP
jgi:unsaturated chondroitin disaccharide hydrolase